MGEPAMIRCEGSGLPGGDRFCTICGRDLTGGEDGSPNREHNRVEWGMNPTSADEALLAHLAAQMGVERGAALHRAIVLLDVYCSLGDGEELTIRHVGSGALTDLYLGWETDG